MGYDEECVESAKKVSRTITKDVIVVFLWSYVIDEQGLVSDLLNASLDTARNQDHGFRARRLEHPEAQQQILLIGAPVLYVPFGSTLKAKSQGLHDIITHVNKIGVALIAHIWVHRLAEWREVLETSGKPKHWDELKRVFAGVVGMDQVTFLSTGWERVTVESGDQEEQRIRDALRKDVEQGLTFEALWNWDRHEAWRVIEGIIASSSQEARKKRRKDRDELNRRTDKEKRKHEAEERKRRHEERKRQEEVRKRREEEERKREEEERKREAEEEIKKLVRATRVNHLQREIEDLHAELDKTEDGQELRVKLEKADQEQRKYIVPLVTQVDNPNIKPAEREKMQKKMEEEYNLYWRGFQGIFDEVRALRIEIGPHLRDFYGLPEPLKPRKKRLGIF